MRLSVCIPTYNFGAFIGPTLESILPQVVDGVEVVVLDGGSTDETTAVVEALQRRYPALRYHRLEARGGIDRDISRTVALARGEYCWLFCADDLMKPGALARMLGQLASGCDVYVCGLTLCTPDMQPIADHAVSRIKADRTFDLGTPAGRRAYFSQALTTTAFFSFAGSLAFKKRRWDAIGLDEAYVGSLWAHVARFFQMIPDGLRLGYIPESYLFKRTENDSFMDRGLAHRYAIAIDGYHRLASDHFGAETIEARHIRRVVTREFPPYVLLDLKFVSQRDRPDDVPLVDRLAAKAYGDRSPRSVAFRLLYDRTPQVAFVVTRAVVRAVRATGARVRAARAA
jgi:O-antigen biosynthesis alpha-1,3-abequosyltransferase